MLAFASFAKADSIQDLKNNDCQLKVDGQLISPRLGTMGHADFYDTNSRVSVMASPVINNTIYISISKAASPVSFSTGYINLKKNHPQDRKVNIINAQICSTGGSEIGCAIDFTLLQC